ncbi:venom serine protease inhibitor-like [Leptodactylus fuscus]|uniref:venom serine protease inhibitor-like n=1 Tax=Leptodactylus fuscus TaxID=238119 RepID=UPI003F4E4999
MKSISVLLLSSLCAVFILISAQDIRTTTPKDCGPNKEFKECGPSCPPNCTHPNGTACNKMCNPGCFCKEGYVLLGDSCIEKEKCLSCTGNKTYSTCLSACPFSCSSKPEMCILMCKGEGCTCKQGYVYLDDKDECVLEEDCPKK